MIEPGENLGKYELIEQVGQGGMAIVYRATDRSLKRTVAVKVLHRHLAEHPEARERFEREAQAVAKLRHENILEIFDYSGVTSEESYIVTEFIEGLTLKDFVRGHELGHPEIGAMICAQVCRALAHAHGLGILHRDVKPENIMIRCDGVVKLTDFGIAQMIDTNRLTVTGQLLGSPAYMSPEHVEGRPLDFRTDVFSVGILLYQLVTHELPFTGRNPHEILKRIADCQYTDPRAKNPRVGKELAAIIARSMARDMADRYASVSDLLGSLERYLEGSGIDECAAELPRFFAAPAAYEMALKERLVAHLTVRGKSLLAEDRVTALELFNRVLTIDADNAEVLAEIDRVSRRARSVRLIALVGAVVLVAAAGVGIRHAVRAGHNEVAGVGPDARTLLPQQAADAAAGVRTTATVDAAPHPQLLADAGRAIASADAAPVRIRPHLPRPPDRTPDAGSTAQPAVQRTFQLVLSPPTSEYRLDRGPWQRASGGRVTLPVGPGNHVVAARNPACCESRKLAISPAQPGGSLSMSLGFLPALITVNCTEPGVTAQVDGVPWKLGRPRRITIESTDGTATVRVEFYTASGARYGSAQTLRVRYREEQLVSCGS